MAKKKEVTSYPVANNVLLEAPIYEKHHRGSNWMAIIDLDPGLPGGLARRFLNRGKGECLYLIEQVGLFAPLEFGADYTTSYGNKQRDRWYGIVVGKTDSKLILEKCASGAKAVLRSKEASVSNKDRAAAIRAEKEALLARAALLEEEALHLEEADALVVAAELPS